MQQWHLYDDDTLNQKMSHAVIGLLNLLSNFNKAFYLSCARSPIGRSKSRHITPAPYVDDNSSLGIIILKYKPNASRRSDGSWSKRDEPSRYEIEHLEYGLISINSPKINDLYIVQGMNLGIHKDLPVFRNYYAHKNAKTQRSARLILPQYLIPDMHPTKALTQVPRTRSIPLILDWLDDFDITVCTLCS